MFLTRELKGVKENWIEMKSEKERRIRLDSRRWNETCREILNQVLKETQKLLLSRVGHTPNGICFTNAPKYLNWIARNHSAVEMKKQQLKIIRVQQPSADEDKSKPINTEYK